MGNCQPILKNQERNNKGGSRGKTDNLPSRLRKVKRCVSIRYYFLISQLSISTCACGICGRMGG